MPQLDLNSFVAQLLWFIVLYGLFSFLLLKVIFPPLINRIRVRPEVIALKNVIFLTEVLLKKKAVKDVVYNSTKGTLSLMNSFFSSTKKKISF